MYVLITLNKNRKKPQKPIPVIILVRLINSNVQMNYCI